MSGNPRIWVLLGHRRGDNNQLLALAEGIGNPFETRTLTYRWFARAWMKIFSKGIGHVEGRSAQWLRPPWPDLVIGIGRRSVPVARWIQAQSGGRTRSIRIGHPRAPNDWFDLVISTRQYPVAPDANVVRPDVAMSRFRMPPPQTAAEEALLQSWPRPHLLLSLGGTAPMWRLDMAALRSALDALARRAEAAGGTLIALASPRTPPEALAVVRDHGAAVVPTGLRYAVALADADEHAVTADSVSMISEAILTGKPVGLVPIAMDARGKRLLAESPEVTRVRDPRRFWQHLDRRGLAGPVAEPKAGQVDDPVALSVAAIRDRLGELFR